LTGLREPHSEFIFTGLPDLSEIYYYEWLFDWFWYSYPYPLYVIKENGEKEILNKNVVDFEVSGETLYYLTANCEFYMRQNGKNELLSELPYGRGYVSEANISIDESGYFIANLHSAFEIVDNYYATDSYKSNFFLSTDGKNFVGIEEYVK
jgi:hypothetical protein